MAIKRYIQLKPQYAKRYIATYKSFQNAHKRDEEWERIFDPRYYDHILENTREEQGE